MKMLHPGFARLHAFVDGELAPQRRERVASHLARCQRCRNEITSLRALRTAAREVPGPPLPENAWERILARRAAGERVLLPTDPVTPGPDAATRGGAPRSVVAPALRRAGFLVLASAGLAAAAIPESPVRQWVEERLQGAEPAVTPRGVPEAIVQVEETTTPTAGVVFDAEGEQAWISIEEPDPALRIRVRLTDEAEVSVEAFGAASDAVFRPRPGGMIVLRPGAGWIDLGVPRHLRRVTVEIDGTPHLVRERGQTRILVPDGAGANAVRIEIVQP